VNALTHAQRPANQRSHLRTGLSSGEARRLILGPSVAAEKDGTWSPVKWRSGGDRAGTICVTPSFPPSANEDHPLLRAVTHDPWIRDRRSIAGACKWVDRGLIVEIYSLE